MTTNDHKFSGSDQELWQAVLGQLQNQMTRATFETWVKETQIVSRENGQIVVGTKNPYAKDWLENRLLSTIQRTVTDIIEHAVEVQFVVKPDMEYPDHAAESQPQPLPPTDPFVPHVREIGEKMGSVPTTSQATEETDQEKSSAFVPHVKDIGGKMGYIPVPEYYVKFVRLYLFGRYRTPGRNAFDLWLVRRFAHRVKVTSKHFTEWTPIAEGPYADLAEAIGVGSTGITGRKDQCVEYNLKKELGLPLECCGRHQQHNIERSKKSGEMHCYFWRPGALEILDREGLLRIASSGKNKHHQLKFQIWHSLPILTPFQVSFLKEKKANEHEQWLKTAALPDRLGLDLEEWYDTPMTTETFIDRDPRVDELSTLQGHYRPDPFKENKK